MSNESDFRAVRTKGLTISSMRIFFAMLGRAVFTPSPMVKAARDVEHTEAKMVDTMTLAEASTSFTTATQIMGKLSRWTSMRRPSRRRWSKSLRSSKANTPITT
jgi:hypothetical protein